MDCKTFLNISIRAILLFVFLLYIPKASPCPPSGNNCYGSGSALLATAGINGEKKAVLRNFKEAVKTSLTQDYMKDDAYLIRFLTEHNFNEQKAEESIKNNLKWRKAEKADSVLKEEWSAYEEKYQIRWTKNKEGNPVIYYHLGSWDLTEQAKSKDFSKISRYLTVKMFENAENKLHDMRQNSNAANVNQFDLVVDMEGFDSSKNTASFVKFYKDVAKQMEEHNAEVIRNVFVINSSNVFKSTFKEITNDFMEDDTKAAVKLLGGRKSFESVLLKTMDKKQINALVD